MKKGTIFLSCLSLLLVLGACTNEVESKKTETTKADMSQVRTDIQAVENEWADAMNKKDIDALMALYADDAMSMQDGGPTLKGKDAIREQQVKDFAEPATYASISFTTQDLYGTPDEVTEVGTASMKDADGKEIATSKYMAVFVKQDGKYKCLREIYNKDTK